MSRFDRRLNDLRCYAARQRQRLSTELNRGSGNDSLATMTISDRVTWLCQQLSHDDPEVARAAAWTFHSLPQEAISDEVLKRLVALVTGDREGPRIAAALALGDLGEPAARLDTCEALLPLAISATNLDVRASALYALGRLTPPFIAFADRSVADGYLRRVDDAYDAGCHSPSPTLRRTAVIAITGLPRGHVSRRLRDSVSQLVNDADTTVRTAARRLDRDLRARSIATARQSSTPLRVSCKSGQPITCLAAPEHLQVVADLIRLGKEEPSSIGDWQQAVDRSLEAARQSEKDTETWTPAERLELATWEAEYHDRKGSYAVAREVLERAVPFPLAAKPFEYLPTLIKAATDRRTLKRAVWVIMLYVWIRFYRAGAYLEARNGLTTIGETIEDLSTKDDPWHATWCRWHYYRAHCLRGVREFREAERVLTAALVDACEHVRLRRTQGMLSRAQHQWAAVVSARIQGSGIGWILLQEGRLHEAERALLQAALQLESTGEESLKLFNRSLIAIATRRRLSPSSRRGKHRDAMRELSECADEYHRIGDLSGELRCRQELCRGFLDLAEFGDDRCASLMASSTLRMMDVLAAQAADQRWMLRCDVLRGRLLLTPLTVHRTRPTLTPDLMNVAEIIERHSRQEPRNGDLLVMRGLIAWVREKDVLARQMLKKASDVAGSRDPVLNREAVLLQAWCVATSIRSRKIETRADETLPGTFLKYCVQPFARARSNEVSFAPRGVDNAYLAILARRVKDLVSEVHNGLFDRIDTHHFPVRMDTRRRTGIRMNLLARLEPRGGETVH